MTQLRNLPLVSSVFVSGVLVLSASAARGQEIRRVAEPFEQVRMARGGYVCDGKLTVSPIDTTYAKLNRDELAKLNANNEAAINRDLKAAVHKQIQALPANLRQMAAIQNLEQGLMDSIDQRLPEGRGTSRAPRPGGPGPANPPATP